MKNFSYFFNMPVLLNYFYFCSIFQGVEFFDEKLNSLCMTWLVDHGEFYCFYNYNFNLFI